MILRSVAMLAVLVALMAGLLSSASPVLAQGTKSDSVVKAKATARATKQAAMLSLGNRDSKDSRATDRTAGWVILATPPHNRRSCAARLAR